MISWMTNADDEAAYCKDCRDCTSKTLNSAHGKPMPCVAHELEYASQEVPVIECHFLDGEKPDLGVDFVNSIILRPTDSMEWLVDHIDAEAYEGRDTVLQLKLKKMTRDALEALPEWEP